MRSASETATTAGLLCGVYVGDKEPGDLDPNENLNVEEREPQNELRVCSRKTQVTEGTMIKNPVVSIRDLYRDRQECTLFRNETRAVDNNLFTETRETQMIKTVSLGPDKDSPNYEEREDESRWRQPAN